VTSCGARGSRCAVTTARPQLCTAPPLQRLGSDTWSAASTILGRGVENGDINGGQTTFSLNQVQVLNPEGKVTGYQTVVFVNNNGDLGDAEGGLKAIGVPVIRAQGKGAHMEAAQAAFRADEGEIQEQVLGEGSILGNVIGSFQNNLSCSSACAKMANWFLGRSDFQMVSKNQPGASRGFTQDRMAARSASTPNRGRPYRAPVPGESLGQGRAKGMNWMAKNLFSLGSEFGTPQDADGTPMMGGGAMGNEDPEGE
jgi:hypothetical protein